MGTLRRALVVGLLGTFALCAVGPLLQWAAGQAVQVVAAGLADGLRLGGVALVVLAGGGALALVVGVWGWVQTQRTVAAIELLQARRGAQELTAPPDVIDGTYHVTEDRYGENPDFVRSQLRRGSPGSR